MPALILFLSATLALAAGTPDPSEKLSPQQRISEAFAAVEKARFGEPRPRLTNSKHFSYVFPPNAGAYRPTPKAECGTLGAGIAEKLGAVRNQDSLGWCFAVVATDILSVETGRRLSHLDLGLQYFRNASAEERKDKNKEDMGDDPSITKFWAGEIDRAVQVGFQGGLCTEKEVPSSDTMLQVLRATPGAGTVPSTNALTNSVLRGVELSAGRNIEAMLADQEDTCESVFAAQLLVPSLSTWQIIATLSSSRTREEAFHWLLNQGCRRQAPRVRPTWAYNTYVPCTPAYGCKDTGRSRVGDLLPKINNFLRNGKPVAMGFDAKRFHASAAANPNLEKAPHAALLIKREFRDGECKYLVRDSRGPTCAGFAKPYGAPKNCARGQYWISEKDIDETIISVGGVE